MVGAAACHQPDDYLPGPSRADEVLAVTLSATTLPADGIARLTITAQLDPRTDLDKRNITFTTTAGSLIAEGKEGPAITVPADTGGTAGTLIAPGLTSGRVVTIAADAAGKAVAELVSDKSVGSARGRVTAFDLPYELTISFGPAEPASIITLAASPAAVPADGVTAIVVSATIAANVPAGRRMVAFRTTLGAITPVAIDADGSNVARASVTSTGTGSARVVATVDGSTAETAVQFTMALPDRVLVSPDVAELKSGGSALFASRSLAQREA
jgi:hypothetical protein